MNARPREALRFYEESLRLKREIGDRKGEAGALINMGLARGDLDEIDRARELLTEGLRLAEDVGAVDFRLSGLEGTAALEKEHGNHEAALAALEQLYALRRRTFNEERARSIAEMRTRYETEKAEREFELQRLKNLELTHQLRQSQRLEAVGRLAGGVAHDFNSLLTAIIGYSELVIESEAVDATSRANVEQIRAAADRASSLTRQLLAFSRKQILKPSTIDLNDTVRRLEKMLRRLIGEDIDLRTDLSAPPALVVADEGQMEQVIVNLAVNARDAMPSGGTLTVATREVEVDEAAAGPLDLAPGPHVRLCVSDTGCGIDEEVASHIFEPFFTTKARDKGTGLGLATVHGIVRQSLGTIGVHSEPGRGAAFEIHLPRAEGAVEVEVAEESVEEWGGEETILLVEDDGAVRTLSCDLLRGRGYRVIAAGSGEEALEIAARSGRRIDLLLTDVVLGGISGTELASLLSLRRPDTRVLYMSGYTDDAIIERGVLKPGTELLSKPFGPRSLARRVREVLDRRGPS